MFTVPSYRQIESGLTYRIKVIDLESKVEDRIAYPLVCTDSKNFAAALDVIETYREQYANKERYRLFVEILTVIMYQEVRLEAFWVDD